MAHETPPLLRLPLELQEIIYKEVLTQPFQAPQLLRVCHEIYTKALKFLFQRALVFQSQSALRRWIEQVPRDLLKYVGEITFELEDVDLTPLLASAASSSVEQDNAVSPIHTWDIYERELGSLRRALGQLPNVKKLSLRTLTGRQPHLYHDFLDNVLEMIGFVYPGLRELCLDGDMHYQSLAFLRSLKALKAFSFDGFSASEATETAEILSSLQLTDISLVSQHALLTPTLHQHSSFTSKLQSFDGSVLRTINQLASFSVTERYSATSSALFFTSEILCSLHNHKTLSSLSIFLSHTPEPNALEALEEFLEKSASIERLELDWPGLDPDVMQNYVLLPVSLLTLWIRATNMATAFDILRNILNSRKAGDSPRLQQVVLVRQPWDTAAPTVQTNKKAQGSAESKEQQIDSPDSDSDSENVARAKKELNDLGVRVAWCTEAS
ncbi:hypothetical protein K458DRAFT_386164 [Lentithecium fluviatile CBS 122367]|uniref:Uncharacterized protein n=1 Tax=Lentithecium fluviatile CBS 122367 TaxID=1168545 RepID=A0A6G1J9X8_9PLEO|nr:hypothetical protein K458DRAFT_386164 [Lentithecium fluviatile CBS 122367]